MSSTKSFTGHLLGAAGAVEAIVTIEAMRHNFVPMTAGTSEVSDYIEANVVYGQGLEQEIPYAISNTFGLVATMPFLLSNVGRINKYEFKRY